MGPDVPFSGVRCDVGIFAVQVKAPDVIRWIDRRLHWTVKHELQAQQPLPRQHGSWTTSSSPKLIRPDVVVLLF